jgi:hypothetical protein
MTTQVTGTLIINGISVPFTGTIAAVPVGPTGPIGKIGATGPTGHAGPTGPTGASMTGPGFIELE